MSGKGANRRDHDQEMSMEEILSSIRRYVTDGDTSPSAPTHYDVNDEGQGFEYEKDEPKLHQEGYESSRPSSYPTTVKTLSDHHYTDSHYGPQSAWAAAPTPMAETVHAPVSPSVPTYNQEHDDVSDDAMSSYASYSAEPKINPHEDIIKSISVNASMPPQKSFEKLIEHAQILKEKTSQSTPIKHDNESSPLEAIAIQAMTPLIKNWLDENLPHLVETLVQKEIEKLTQSLLKR